MDLVSGKSLWLSGKRFSVPRARMQGNVRCDVAVIGAGITGALVAHALIEAGKRIVILDKREPLTGSTSASTALLSYETDVSLPELTRRKGLVAGRRVYRLGQEAIRELARLVKTLRIDCDFEAKPSLYLASDARGWTSLKREYAARRRALIPVRRLSRRTLGREFGLDFPGALYGQGCAQIDAVKLAAGVLSHHARGGRLRVFTRTRVRKIERRADGVVLRTATRRTIHARHVIVATGYEAAPFLEDGLVKLNSSYVIGSQAFPPGLLWRDECLIWETARPYFYLRTTPDHRILIGGEDEPFSDPRRRDALLKKKRRRLEKCFRALFPAIPFRTEFCWTGTFGETQDGLPFIGPKEGDPRVLYALGYGGNGITFSQIAARLLTQYCLGRRPRDADLFSLNR
jgi:glycine/D-amino acid oxidase-like deaminating enzyme